MKEEQIKKLEHRVKTHWPFMRISEADFKLLKKIERMERLKQPKTPQGQEAPF